MEKFDGDIELLLSVEGLPYLGHGTSSHKLLQFVFANAAWVCAHELPLSFSGSHSLYPLSRDDTTIVFRLLFA